MGPSATEQVSSDFRTGKLIVYTDDLPRENKGDLICATGFASAELANRMVGLARGLIYLPVAVDCAEKFGLLSTSVINSDNRGTILLVSTDYVETTAGISVAEYTLTAREPVVGDAALSDFHHPDHLPPLLARPHDVPERYGYTEAIVDLCHLARLKLAGLHYEAMRGGGEMMRTKELLAPAERKDLYAISIEDLVRYREHYNCALEKVASAALPNTPGGSQAYGFLDPPSELGHLALVEGDFTGKEAVPCHVYSECTTGDTFGFRHCDYGKQLQRVSKRTETGRQDVLLYLHQGGRGIGLFNKLKAYMLQRQGLDTVDTNRAFGFPDDLRNYALAAAMLRTLSVRSLCLMTNNPDRIVQLTDSGISVISCVSIRISANCYDIRYFCIKRHRMGRLLDSTLPCESCRGALHVNTFGFEPTKKRANHGSL